MYLSANKNQIRDDLKMKEPKKSSAGSMFVFSVSMFILAIGGIEIGKYCMSAFV